MVQTKEDKSKYDKQYRLDNSVKIKAYMEKNKLELKEKRKIYTKTPQGKKINRINNWKSRQIKSEDYNLLYEYYLSITNCENCNVLLTEDKTHTRTTKCLDHNHLTGEFRNILCHSCNTNSDRLDNTSGIPNIRYYENKKLWTYTKIINKNRHLKYFKKKEDAIEYKRLYELNL